MYALEAEDLSKSFGSLNAVRGVTLHVESDSLHAVIGPNGAGKTTLFNLLSGTIPPTSGRVRLAGKDITGVPLRDLVAHGVGRTFQTTSLFPELSVFENIRLASYVTRRHSMRERLRSAAANPADKRVVDEVIERFRLGPRSETTVAGLSHGDRRKVELALLTAQDPSMLLLDEPTAGLAAEEIPTLLDMIRGFREERRTVLLVEHNMEVVMSLADSVTVMSQGTVIAEGTPIEISANAEVQEIYLGKRGAFRK